MYNSYVEASKAQALKAKREKMFDPEEMQEDPYPVDMNYACVALDKDDPDNLEEADELNKIRFGLTEDGV